MTNPVIIGDATLYLGDCREIVPTLETVEMIFTDPPYGHNKGCSHDPPRLRLFISRPQIPRLVSLQALPKVREGGVLITAAELLNTPTPLYSAAPVKRLNFVRGNAAAVLKCFEAHPDGLWLDDVARKTGLTRQQVSWAAADMRDKLDVVAKRGNAKKFALKGRE